jgi:hypothetical protein
MDGICICRWIRGGGRGGGPLDERGIARRGRFSGGSCFGRAGGCSELRPRKRRRESSELGGRAVRFGHGGGLPHGGLKADNFLFAGEGRIDTADFSQFRGDCGF